MSGDGCSPSRSSRGTLGRALLGAPHRLLAGIEYQYWRNKLGTDRQESTAQLLLVWRP